jgi:aspartyl-tRNA(Asn)/glutamyl-tRNA(Gln) amidotransferase subunit A
VEGVWLARPDTPGAGVPVAVKDLLDTAGLVTTYGSALFADHVPDESAESVRRLEAAGYAVAGKTNLHEFAYGISSQNPHCGTVPNPVAPGRLAGGSSGGSAAAIANGDVELALGTDSAGSIRIPAAWCGIVGFKPTHELVSSAGCFPLAPSFDTVGPMAATVEGCEELLAALVPDYSPAPLESLAELSVGLAWTEHADPLVRARVEEAATLFPHRRAVDFPLPPEGRGEFAQEVAGVHGVLFPGNEELYGENVRGKIERCLAVGDDEAEASRRERAEYRERADEAFEGLDLLVTPTMPCVAPPADVDELEIRIPATTFTYPVNALGWPALALPCGAAELGLPASVQIVGRAGDDARVLAAGSLLASLVRGTATA